MQVKQAYHTEWERRRQGKEEQKERAVKPYERQIAAASCSLQPRISIVRKICMVLNTKFGTRVFSFFTCHGIGLEAI